MKVPHCRNNYLIFGHVRLFMFVVVNFSLMFTKFWSCWFGHVSVPHFIWYCLKFLCSAALHWWSRWPWFPGRLSHMLRRRCGPVQLVSKQKQKCFHNSWDFQYLNCTVVKLSDHQMFNFWMALNVRLQTKGRRYSH